MKAGEAERLKYGSAEKHGEAITRVAQGYHRDSTRARVRK